MAFWFILGEIYGCIRDRPLIRMVRCFVREATKFSRFYQFQIFLQPFRDQRNYQLRCCGHCGAAALVLLLCSVGPPDQYHNSKNRPPNFAATIYTHASHPSLKIWPQCPSISKLHLTTPNRSKESAISQNQKNCLAKEEQHHALSSYKALLLIKEWTCQLCLAQPMVLLIRSPLLIIDTIISSSSLLTSCICLWSFIDVIIRPDDVWIAILGQFNF